MNAASQWPDDFSHVSDKTLELAQRAFKEHRLECFWFMPADLRVTRDMLGAIIRGLRLHGGHQGYKLAAELCH